MASKDEQIQQMLKENYFNEVRRLIDETTNELTIAQNRLFVRMSLLWKCVIYTGLDIESESDYPIDEMVEDTYCHQQIVTELCERLAKLELALETQNVPDRVSTFADYLVAPHA